MATQRQANDQLADLITCAVCLDEFNEKHRAPKFLTCSHTICLECLKSIAANGRVSCPLCRSVVACPDGVEKLPNNTWALHMVEIKNRPTVIRWCWSCRASAEATCSESHPTFLIDNSRLEEVHKLQRRASLHAARLERAQERGKSLDNYYNKILATLRSAVKDVEQQMANHQLHLTHLASLADEYHRAVGMIDTFQTVKEQLERSIEDSEQEIELNRRIWWEYATRLKMKIAVHLFDEQNRKMSTVSTLEQGFGKDLQPYNRELELMTYALFSYLKLQNVQLVPQEGVVAQPRTPSTMAEVKTKFKKILSGSKMLLANGKSTPPGGGQQLSASHRWRREKLPQTQNRPRSLGNILDPGEQAEAAQESASTAAPSVDRKKNSEQTSTSQQSPSSAPPIPPRGAHNPEAATTSSTEQIPQIPQRGRRGVPPPLRFSPQPAVRGPSAELMVANAIHRPPFEDDWLPLTPSGPSSLSDNKLISFQSTHQLADAGRMTTGQMSVPCTPTSWAETIFTLESLPPATKPPPPPKQRTVYPSSSDLQEFATFPL